jgi:hypothetical protein
LDLCHPGGEGGVSLLLVFLRVFLIVFRTSVVTVVGIVAGGRGAKQTAKNAMKDREHSNLRRGLRVQSIDTGEREGRRR